VIVVVVVVVVVVVENILSTMSSNGPALVGPPNIVYILNRVSLKKDTRKKSKQEYDPPYSLVDVPP